MSGGETEAAVRPGGLVAAWLLVILPALMLTILLQRPIWDVDIFWQLKLGEMILARGGPVPTEPFAVTHLGEPLPAVAWLGQAVMAEIRLLWGWTGLRIFDAVCWLGGFVVVAAACRRRGASVAGVAIGLAVAFYIALPTASIRPQTFAVLGFGLVLALLRLELKPWRMSLFAVPLLLLWQNLHPSASVAAVAFGAHAAVDWARWLRKRGSPPWETSLLAIWAAAVMFATPDGFAALRISGENARASAAMGVSEWLPLWDSVNAGGVLPVVLATLAAAALVLRRPSRADPREIAVALALLVLTVFANRFVLVWVIALIPVFARTLLPPPHERRLPAMLGSTLILAAAVVTPLQHPTYFAPEIPLATLHALRDRGVAGTIFTHIPWGGPAIDIGYPRWRVAYDGRFYRYTPAEWQFYRDIRKDKVPLAEVVRRYDPAAFVLDPVWNKRLIAELRVDPQWEQLPADPTALAFKRKSAALP